MLLRSLSFIYAAITRQLTHFSTEFWGSWLLTIGLGYGIKDYFLEGYTYISEKEFENGNYPNWVKNRGDYYISYENRDETVYKIKRRIVFESRWIR